MVTQAGMMVGSPAYMAPEQINGAEGASASDRWSLGVLLYQMLTGKPPFAGQGIASVLYQVTHAPVPSVPDASPAVQGVLTRALDRDPSRRYPSACALARAFRCAITPRQPPARAARRPASPRHGQPYWATLLGLSALLLAAVGGGMALRHQDQKLSKIISTRPARRQASPHAASASPPITRIADARQGRRVPRSRRRAARHIRVAAGRRAAARTAPPQARVLLGRAPRARRFRPAAAASLPERSSPRRGVRLTSLRFRPRVQTSPPALTAGGAASPDLVGTWHGTNTRNPATLTITHVRPGGFEGVMTVQTHEALVRVAVTGRVSGERVAMRETRILSQSKPRAWDLGSETGVLAAGGRMGGRGRT